METPKSIAPGAMLIHHALTDGRLKADSPNRDLAAVACCHPRTANRYLTSLEQAGLVRIVRVIPNAAGLGTDPTGRRLFAVPRDVAELVTRAAS
jgi:hypothetical protein